MKLNLAFALVSLIVTGIVSLQAQPVNVQQFQNTQAAQQFQAPLPGSTSATNAPELYTGENEDTGPQRILRLTPRPDYFNILLDSQVFYSDNANFGQHRHRLNSSVFVNTFQATFAPPEIALGPGKFSPAAGFISQWYNYGSRSMSSLDFNAQTAFVSGRYNLGNWQFGAGGNYTRLVSQPDYSDQTYSEWLPALTAQRVFTINDSFLFVIADQVDYHFTSVPPTGTTSSQINDRFDEAIGLTASWQITRQLNLQPYYRFQYSRYRSNFLDNSNLNNYLHTFGVTLAYYFNRNFSVRGFYSYNIKESNDPSTPGYTESESGVGASVNISF